MARGIILGGIIGGIVVFIWMMVSWMVLPWHCKQMRQFRNEDFVTWVMKENAKKDGIYVIPFPSDCGVAEEGKAMMKSDEAMKKGPIVFASIRRAGINPKNPVLYIVSLLTQIVSAGFISFLVLHSRSEIGYFRRVIFTAIVGLVAGLLCFIPPWNWMGFPTNWMLIGIADLIIGWFLAGFVIAAFTKSK